MTKPVRVCVIFGTRPEAIKMAPVVRALQSSPTTHCSVVVTAQHREMLDQVLEIFSITPEYDLDIMSPGQDLFDVTTGALVGLRDVLCAETPDLVLVHGDTTTCMTGALAAFYLGIPVGHVEAGLRTGDIRAPFPEEVNRSIVGRIAELNFAPTERARQNLLQENVSTSRIVVTGNTVIDALLDVRGRVRGDEQHSAVDRLPKALVDEVLDSERSVILVTGHRRESFGQGFVDLCNAIRQIADADRRILVVYPVHLNPNVQRTVYDMLSGVDNIRLTEPLEYRPFVWLLDQSDLVITDSGGIQEEAPSLGKPVLVTREVTERPEAVEAGTVRLVGTSTHQIVTNALEILREPTVYKSMSEAHNPYGDGQASGRIVASIDAWWSGRE